MKAIISYLEDVYGCRASVIRDKDYIHISFGYSTDFPNKDLYKIAETVTELFGVPVEAQREGYFNDITGSDAFFHTFLLER